MSNLIEENGVKVKFPDDNDFQFGNCAAYKKIKSQGVKETDVGWFDTHNNILWLVELKAFDNQENKKFKPQDLSNPIIIDYWLSELVDKSIHAVCMSNTNRSLTQSCLPFTPDHATKIKIVHLIKVIPGQDSYLNPMQDKLRLKLKAYSAIFNISSISIVSYDLAVHNRLLNWIV
jgi:hypothetical protein